MIKTEQSQTNNSKHYFVQTPITRKATEDNTTTTTSHISFKRTEKNYCYLTQASNQSKKQFYLKVAQSQSDDFLFRLKLKMVTLLKMLELESRDFMDVQRQSAPELLQILTHRIKEYGKRIKGELKEVQNGKKTLEIRIIQLQTQIIYLQTTLETINKKNQRLLKQNKTEVQKLSKKTQELEESKMSCFQEQNKNKELLQAQALYVKALEEKNKEIQKSKIQIQKSLQKQLDEKAILVNKHKEERNKIEGHCELLKDSLMNSTKTINEQSQQIKKLKLQIDHQQSSMKKNKIQNQKKLNQLTYENKVLSENYEKEMKNFEKNVCELKKSENYAKQLEQKIYLYDEKIISLSQNISSLSKQIQDKVKQIQNLKRNFVQAKEKFMEMNQIAHKLPKLEEQIVNLKLIQEKEIKTVKEEYELRVEEILFDKKVQLQHSSRESESNS